MNMEVSVIMFSTDAIDNGSYFQSGFVCFCGITLNIKIKMELYSFDNN